MGKGEVILMELSDIAFVLIGIAFLLPEWYIAYMIAGWFGVYLQAASMSAVLVIGYGFFHRDGKEKWF